MSAMKRLFQVMAEKKASDIFLSVGSPINIKINGVDLAPAEKTIELGKKLIDFRAELTVKLIRQAVAK